MNFEMESSGAVHGKWGEVIFSKLIYPNSKSECPPTPGHLPKLSCLLRGSRFIQGQSTEN